MDVTAGPEHEPPTPNVLESLGLPNVLTGPNRDDPPFSRARSIAGLGLLTAGIVLMLIDAVSVEFDVDTIQLGLILGTSLLFLGVEAGKRFIK